MSPNEYYDTSPFLFWSIMVTGSRRYTEDPTILDKTSQLITPLAFSSMALRSTPIPVIQGLLILCTWRLPTNSMYKDMTHVLCGAAVHLATQIGLHVAGVGQDFARMPVKKDQEQAIFRAKLWMQCVIASIRYIEMLASNIAANALNVDPAALKAYRPSSSRRASLEVKNGNEKMCWHISPKICNSNINCTSYCYGLCLQW